LAWGLCHMPVAVEEHEYDKYTHITFVEFLEFIARAAVFKYEDLVEVDSSSSSDEIEGKEYEGVHEKVSFLRSLEIMLDTLFYHLLGESRILPEMKSRLT